MKKYIINYAKIIFILYILLAKQYFIHLEILHHMIIIKNKIQIIFLTAMQHKNDGGQKLSFFT